MSTSGSTTQRKEQKTNKILDLPTELLQHIASFLPPDSILELRLTCTTLESTTLDIFSEEFISSLKGFMLDPARLARLKNILTTPQLAIRVRTVAVTLCARDSRKMALLAPEKGQDYEEAYYNWLSNNEIDQHDQHLCKVEGLSTECETLLEGIVDKVALYQKCSIVIDVRSEDEVYRTVSKRRPQLMKEIVQMALRAGCVVGGLKLMDDFALKAAHFQQGGAFQDMVQGLREFSYVTPFESDDDLDTTWNQQHWQVISEALQNAESLQDFYLATGNPRVERIFGATLSHLCSTAFATARLSCLSTLKLLGTIVSKDALVHLLKQCADTLTTCHLQYMIVVGSGDIWIELVKLLSSMSRLKTIYLAGVCKQPAGVSPDEARMRTRTVRFLTAGEEAKQLAIKMNVPGESIDAHPFLEKVVAIRYDSFL